MHLATSLAVQLPAICVEGDKDPPVEIKSAFHQSMYSLAISSPFNVFVVIVVLVNTVQMILLTSAYQRTMNGPYSAPTVAVGDFIFSLKLNFSTKLRSNTVHYQKICKALVSNQKRWMALNRAKEYYRRLSGRVWSLAGI